MPEIHSSSCHLIINNTEERERAAVRMSVISLCALQEKEAQRVLLQTEKKSEEEGIYIYLKQRKKRIKVAVNNK